MQNFRLTDNGPHFWTEAELLFGVYREHGDVVVGGALVLELVMLSEDDHRRHPVREDLA